MQDQSWWSLEILTDLWFGQDYVDCDVFSAMKNFKTMQIELVHNRSSDMNGCRAANSHALSVRLTPSSKLSRPHAHQTFLTLSGEKFCDQRKFQNSDKLHGPLVLESRGCGRDGSRTSGGNRCGEPGLEAGSCPCTKLWDGGSIFFSRNKQRKGTCLRENHHMTRLNHSKQTPSKSNHQLYFMAYPQRLAVTRTFNITQTSDFL